MKKTIAVAIALAIGAVTPAATFAGGRKVSVLVNPISIGDGKT